jgi:hypothetical protein
VPADHKWFARVVIGATIISTLEKLDLHFPKVDKSELSEFKKVREALKNESKSAVRKKVAVKNAATEMSGAVSGPLLSGGARGPGRTK